MASCELALERVYPGRVAGRVVGRVTELVAKMEDRGGAITITVSRATVLIAAMLELARISRANCSSLIFFSVIRDNTNQFEVR